MGKEWKHLLRFRCTCCADCCREPIVLVTDEDVRRVMAHTGQKASEVLRFYKTDDIEWSPDKPEWIKLKSGLRIMGLRRASGGCQYLGEDDLCSIYEHRPVTCRRYPFDVELDEGGEVEFFSISKSVRAGREHQPGPDQRHLQMGGGGGDPLPRQGEGLEPPSETWPEEGLPETPWPAGLMCDGAASTPPEATPSDRSIPAWQGPVSNTEAGPHCGWRSTMIRHRLQSKLRRPAEQSGPPQPCRSRSAS